MRRLTIALALAVLALAGAAERAVACSCAGHEGPLSLKSWDGAVSARLLRVEPRPGDSGRATFAYKVRRVFKGRHEYDLHRGFHLRIESYLNGATCGLPGREGRRYGLLLYEWRGELEANLCTVVPQRKLRDAADRRGTERANVSRVSECQARRALLVDA